MYKALIRPLLFLLEPEKAHKVTIFLLKSILFIPGLDRIFQWYSKGNNKHLRYDKKGLRFPNRVGLAAGFDKDAVSYKALRHLGFGSIEVGTVTPLPQDGNPQPRLFRLPADEAMINRMGFNNLGVKAMKKRLESRPDSLIVGGNIGKNKLTPNENAIEDYLISFRELVDVVDYFAINVSSPNTPGLRDLQEKEPLLALIKAVQEEARHLEADQPILLKIAPDLSKEQLDDIIDIVATCELDGVIATNTTISRESLTTSAVYLEQIGAGGLSGKPVRNRSTEVISYLRESLGDDSLIIGVGGIFSAEDALEKIKAGADIIQLYTGFIYEGPTLLRQIHNELLRETL
ncbi:MAG: quinone-dependent dihydroorotate dehydrogenase [Bacteroidia bacterium]